MTSQIRSAIDFYDRHPISAQIILAKLVAARGTLEGLTPDDLFPHDQDHYGGLAANDALGDMRAYRRRQQGGRSLRRTRRSGALSGPSLRR